MNTNTVLRFVSSFTNEKVSRTNVCRYTMIKESTKELSQVVIISSNGGDYWAEQMMDTSDKFMVSFDVASLFTNMPLDDSIVLAVDYILKGNADVKLSRDNLRKLFMYATAQTHFSSLGNYYDQVDGVAMGSPLAPVLSLANIFMGHHERIWLEQYSLITDGFFSRKILAHARANCFSCLHQAPFSISY